MLMHGFTIDEISEFADIKKSCVKAVYQKSFENKRLEYLKKLYKRRGRYDKVIDPEYLMYSKNEMDYGYVSPHNYDKELFTGEERQILYRIERSGLKKEFEYEIK